MCALLRELIVPVADLHRLAVECGNCKAVTVLDFTTRIQRQGGPVAPLWCNPLFAIALSTPA